MVAPGSGGEAKAGTRLTSPDLEIIQGDVTKKADVEKLLDDSDIAGVVVALGGRTKEVGTTVRGPVCRCLSVSTYWHVSVLGQQMLTDGTKNVIEVMKSQGVSKIAVVTSIGAGAAAHAARSEAAVRRFSLAR